MLAQVERYWPSDSREHFAAARQRCWCDFAMESGVSAGQLSRLVSCARSTTASMIERMADRMMLRNTIEPKTK